MHPSRTNQLKQSAGRNKHINKKRKSFSNKHDSDNETITFKSDADNVLLNDIHSSDVDTDSDEIQNQIQIKKIKKLAQKQQQQQQNGGESTHIPTTNDKPVKPAIKLESHSLNPTESSSKPAIAKQSNNNTRTQVDQSVTNAAPTDDTVDIESMSGGSDSESDTGPTSTSTTAIHSTPIQPFNTGSTAANSVTREPSTISQAAQLVLNNSNQPGHLIIVLINSSLETIKTKKGYELISSDTHHKLLNKLDQQNTIEYRPDITHQCLLTLLDSPLNKSGKLSVYIQTYKNVLIQVNSKIRIPRTYKRFAGLMGMYR